MFWAGVTDGGPSLHEAASQVNARLRSMGLADEDRPFAPHLTLARVRVPAGLRSGALFAGLHAEAIGRQRVVAITLVESTLSPRWPSYRALQQTPLGAGLAFAAKYEREVINKGNGPKRVCLCYLGDGALNQGALHEAMAEQILAFGPDLIGATGAFAEAFEGRGLGRRLVTAPDADALGLAVAARLRGGELVLLKASRGVQLEKAIPHLTGGREAPCSTTS